MDLNECRKIAVILREAEKRIASGNPADDFKKLLNSAADTIENLINEVESLRRNMTCEDDPYRPLWPSWDN